MGSEAGEGLVAQLHKLGARTAAPMELTEEEACTEYGMTPEFFDQAWPAYFAQIERASPSVPPSYRFAPLQPNPDPVGLLFPSGAPSATRPSAVVLRDPWEIYDLDDAAFAPYVDELEAAIAAFNKELTAWALAPGSRYGPILPASLKSVGDRQVAAMRRLVKPILQKSGRKLSSFESGLLPNQYQLLRGHLFLADLIEAGRRIAITIARGRAAFDSDLDVQDATIRRLEVIGECNKVLAESPLWPTLAGAPWGDAAGMRDVLAHSFIGINLDVVWQVASEHIPKLLTVLLAEESID